MTASYEDDDVECLQCHGSMTWHDCTDCEDGYYDGDELGRDDDPPCNVCDGQGGWWYCEDCN